MPQIPSRVRSHLEAVGVARSRDLEKLGLSRMQLKRFVERGLVERPSRGLYTLPDARRTESQDLAEASLRVPNGVICLLSALRFHGLTTQNPSEVWIAIGHKAWRPKIDHPPLRLIYLSGSPLQEGVEGHDISGVKVQIFSPAKTVADCFKFRNKIGIDVAVEALKDYRRLYPKQLESLWRHASVDRVATVLQPYLMGVE